MIWHNEPTTWHEQGSTLSVTANPKTDIWRVTLHNYITDNAHFYYQEVRGDFTATVKVSGDYVALYDQAGLMVRESETVWLKCGVENLEGVLQASAVITRDFSDWSLMPLAAHIKTIWARVKRIGTAVEVYVSEDGTDYTLIRQGYLSAADTLMVGMMCAAPIGDGFMATFEEFLIA